MRNEREAALATTVLAKEDCHYERVRANLALDTIYEARMNNYDIIVVDGGSPDKYICQMIDLGAIVYPQDVPGMGNARRQSLRHAKDAVSENGAVVWLEPEKSTLVPLLRPAVDKIVTENYDLVMFRRKSLDSYPPEQIHTYKMVELAFKYLTNIECDFLFGPVALSNRSIDYFLAYKSKYGDVWDSIHIPKLHIIRDGLPWTQIEINYQHPQVQTQAEQGNMELLKKRIDQIRVITNALISETHDIEASPSNPIA